jgi:8-oxo-dGTP pyrophosphatase MutT (NUDIX family)
MMQMYKVYYNNRFVCISESNKSFPDAGGYWKLTGAYNIREEWYKFKNEPSCKGMYMEGHVKGIWNKFKAMFVVVKAAGGLVKNDKGEYLLIFRNGKWDLPKGKLEKKETMEMAAVREVEEECGVTGLKITGKLGESFHIYEEFLQIDTMKNSHWYEMTCSDTGELKPQAEEGIEKAVWANAAQIKEYSANMYPSVWDILKDKI